ncbi:MAG: murein hydrolase activator EnvC family protein [Thermoanaerobaculia bacterium]
MRRAALILALAAIVAVVPLGTDTGLAQAVDAESKAALEHLRQEVRSLRSTLERVRGQAKSAERDLEATRLELEILERELGMAQEVQAGLELQSNEAAVRIEALHGDIARQKRFLAERMAALYRLGSLSYLRLLLTMEEEQNPLESLTLLSYLISRDGREIDRFRSMQRDLAAERTGIEERTRKIADLRAAGDQKRLEIAARKRDQEILLKTLRRQEGRSEERLAELEERAQRLERLLGILYGRKREDSIQAAKVSEFRGALQWPLKGDVIENFGKVRSQKFATYTVNNGIKIAAAPGSSVSAVFYGTVIYSQWFKGYGNLVVVDHGERVYSLYGNTRGPVVGVGNKVTPGQVITSVAEGDDGGGFLYFEVREDNKPADPRRWLR